MDRGVIERVRAFSRTVADRTGTVSDRFLGLRRPMVESRILWEIGPDGIEIRDLRSRMGLDSGYLTRVLQSLARQRLVSVQTDRHDRRVRRVRLTKSGRAEVAEIDRLSDGVARELVEPLNASQRERLVTAMDEVRRLLQAPAVRVDMADPHSSDAQWCLQQYFAELRVRFEDGFDPGRDPADESDLVPPAGALFVARLHGRPVGCAAIRFHAGEPPQIKRMWVARTARGAGIGKRLLAVLERYARDAGAKRVRLQTNRALTEAIQLYRSSSYKEVEPFNDVPYAHHFFEKRL